MWPCDFETKNERGLNIHMAKIQTKNIETQTEKLQSEVKKIHSICSPKIPRKICGWY